MEKQLIPKIFLFILIGIVLFASYLIFRPFLAEIFVAMILVTIFYSPFESLVSVLKGKRNLAAFLMCLLIALLVIVPLVNFLVIAGKQTVDGYDKTRVFITDINLKSKLLDSGFLENFNALGLSSDTIKEAIIDLAKKANQTIFDGAQKFVKGTTSFVISLFLIFLAMFFFFVDGKVMLERVMQLTPLPNKYDRAIFKKFKDVSMSTMISTFGVAVIQGFIGAIGFIIVGVPAFFAGLAMAFLALLPYIGAAFVWFPVGVYLLLAGKIWQGIFLLFWGTAIVSTSDNLIRAYIIKGKAQVHPIFVIFSILGGITLFGFWGIIFGPLIISLAVTILEIYEMEYGSMLEK